MKYVLTLPVLAAIGLAVAWFLLLRPIALGGPASYHIVSGTSMEPALHPKDLVIALAQSDYSVGDVVVLRVPDDQPLAGSLVVHRIVGGDGTSGFVVKGDNKPAPDPWRPTKSDIVGRSWIELPGGGAVVMMIRRPTTLAALLAGGAAFWFLMADVSLPRRRQRQEPST